MSSQQPCEPKDLSKPGQVSGNSLLLSIRGIGVPPNFKNSKMVITNPKANGFHLITAPKHQKWMKKAIQSFASQLRSSLATGGGATSTDVRLASLIALCPLDDSWQWVPEITVKAEFVTPGNEGADILIERLPDKEPMLFPD